MKLFKDRFFIFWPRYSKPGYEMGLMKWMDVRSKWEAETKAKHPVQYYLRENFLYDIKYYTVGKLGKAWWWVKYHTNHRYHILKLSSKETGYTYGYSDPRQLLLNASFAIFRRFAEDENGLESLKHNADPEIWLKHCHTDEEKARCWDNINERARIYEDALDLYNWWFKGGRKAEHEAHDKQFDEVIEKYGFSNDSPEARAAWAAHHDAEWALDNRDDDQLKKLAGIRQAMWT
jgi:hypothetical protein